MSGHLDRQEQPLFMFPAGHGWEGNGKGSFSDAGGELAVNGDRSFKIETNGNEEAAVATSPEISPVDLFEKHIVVHAEVSFSSRLKTVALRLSSGSIESDYAEATIWETDEDPVILGSTFERQSIPREEFAVTGSINWSGIKRAQLRVTDNKTGKVTLYAAGIYAVPTMPNGRVSIAFDDGYASTRSIALPRLSPYRMPATCYVITDILGKEEQLKLEDLYALRDQHDWEIAGHALTVAAHNKPNGLDDLEGEELEEELDGLRAWMDEHGFARRTFAYPKGAAGQEVRKIIKSQYGGGRVTARGPETNPTRDDYIVRGWSINSSFDTVAAIKEAITNASQRGEWLVLTFHKLVTTPAAETEFATADFDEIVDHIGELKESGDIEVLTVADAMGAPVTGSTGGAGGGGSKWSETKVFTIPDEIKVPSGDIDFIPPFFISLTAGQTAKVTKVIHRLNSGTSATFKLQKNGTDLTGFTGIEAKAEIQTTDPGDQELGDGDKLAMVVTAVSGAPKNLSVAVVIEYTVP